MNARSTLVALALILAGAQTAQAVLTTTWNPKTGEYNIASSPTGWKVGGTLAGIDGPIQTAQGKDAIGDYVDLTASAHENGVAITASIRTYELRNVALFTLTYTAATDKPSVAFPDFTSLPSDAHSFTFADKTFSPYDFSGAPGHAPWMLFDDHANALILSPASHFFVQRLSGDGKTRLASILNPEVQHVPGPFSQRSLLAMAPGINYAFDMWGTALTDLEGKICPSNEADIGLKTLGYWTDNGATYYYNYDTSLGYEGTLLKEAEHLHDAKIPIGNLQLDSWWYAKSLRSPEGKVGKTKNPKFPEGEWNRYGGLLDYTAQKAVIPDGMDGFEKKLQLPMITHNRWIDRDSPYHEHYKITGVAAIDPKWWQDIMTYLQSGGVYCYEQDWLDRIYEYSPDLASDPDAGDLFMDGMANAARDHGMSVQYCMTLPCNFLEASRYGNVTTSRVSNDSFNRSKWKPFLFTSRFASALGIWPWGDVCKSTDETSMLLQDLSGGLVGFGDAIGKENRDTIMKTIRDDGQIIKPDTAIVPLDSTYVNEAAHGDKPIIAAAYTDDRDLRTAYVFALRDDHSDHAGHHEHAAADEHQGSSEFQFPAHELGMSGPVYVYNFFNGTTTHVDDGKDISGTVGKDGTAYCIVASPHKSGIALFGDMDKFVSAGKRRIASLTDEPGKLTAELLLSDTEKTVKLHGAAASAPKVSVEGGAAGLVDYDAGTGHFSVTITADGGAGTRVVFSR